MSRLGRMGHALYTGEVSYDFVGRRKLWYTISGIIIVIAIAGLLGPKLNLGVEFTGGSVFTFPAKAGSTVEQVRDAAESSGAPLGDPIVQQAGSNWRVTTESLAPNDVTKVQDSVAKRFELRRDDVSPQIIGPTWGGEVSNSALRALLIFLAAVVLYLSLAFEFKMALSALVALAHDMVITIGVYAWSGFEVTPATLIGFLTILGYSLYDTVVVFDKVRENTAGLLGGAKMTYSQAANLAVNQTLVRSINTTVLALLPVAAILFIGTTLLGAGTLKDLSLALFVGMLAGAISSIFLATPLLAQLKEREPQYQALARRLSSRGPKAAAGRDKGAGKEPAMAPNGGSPESPEKRKKR